MRALVGICAILVLANVGVFLWPDTANSASHVHTEKSDVNPHFLRLNKEIEEKFFQQKEIAPLTVTRTDDFVAGSSGSNCYRIGPFMHQSNYELAQAVLFNAEVNFKKSKRASKSSNAFRVYLGPYDTRAEVSDMRVELKRKKILDHFVRKEELGGFVISLGIYSTRETAETAVGLFDGSLSGVKLKDEQVVLPESFWLHFSVSGKEQVRSQLAQMDWGEPSAKMGKYHCQI